MIQMTHIFYLFPVIGAITGIIIVSLLTWLLFRPWLPVSIAGLRIQGAIPALIGKARPEISSILNNELPALLADPLVATNAFAAIKPLVESHMDEFLRHKLPVRMPMIGMFIGDKTISTLREIFLEEIGQLFPGVLASLAGQSPASHLQPAIDNYIQKISPQTIESRLNKQLTPYRRKAMILGAIIGLISGLLQALLIHILT